MANYFRLDDRVEILPGAKVIKAEQVTTILSVEDLLGEANAKRKKILSESRAAFKAEKERGYEEGVERAKRDKADSILNAKKTIAEYTKKMEASVSDIVQSILSKVLGQFDQSELVLTLVSNTVKDYTKSQKLRLMVMPDHVDYLNSHIEALIQQHPVIEFIEVIPDYSVDEGSCIIDAQSEMIFISLEDQLAAIMDMMKEATMKSG